MTAIELIFWPTGRNRKYIEVYKFDTNRIDTCTYGRNYIHNAVHSLQGVPLNTLHLKVWSRPAGDVAQYHPAAVLKHICLTCPALLGM